MATRGIVITSFGDRRDKVEKLTANVRRFSDLPITVLSEDNCETFWPGHPRWGQRNSDLHKATAVLRRFYDVVLVLDDDMRIVSGTFVNGFRLAERYGVCLPENPRRFFGVDLQVGADTREARRYADSSDDLVMPPHNMTANNMGTIFADFRSPDCRQLFAVYWDFMKRYPCRGPVAMGVARWKERVSVEMLSAGWCLCAEDVGHSGLEPVIVHVGHEKVRRWYEQRRTHERATYGTS